MNRRTAGSRLLRLAAIILLANCASNELPGTTSDFALTGVAVIQGLVVDTTRAPLDSFHVGLSPIVSNTALYSSVEVVTTDLAGRYSVRVERRGGGPPSTPDSILATLNAWSLKASDRRADGSRQTASVQVWLRFEPPSRAPYSLASDIPVTRLP